MPHGKRWKQQDLSGGSNCRRGGSSKSRSRRPAAVANERILTDEQRKHLLAMEPTPGEDTVKTAERTTKGLEYCTADKAVGGLEKTESNCKKVLLRVKSYQTTSQSTRKLFMIGTATWRSKFHCCLLWRHCNSHPNPQQPPSCSVSSHQHGGKNLPLQKDENSES